MKSLLKDNIVPDFGLSKPFDSRTLDSGKIECTNPDFNDKYIHRVALMKANHLGSKGDIDEQGIPGWSVKRVCNGCGKEFGERIFIPDSQT